MQMQSFVFCKPLISCNISPNHLNYSLLKTAVLVALLLVQCQKEVDYDRYD